MSHASRLSRVPAEQRDLVEVPLAHLGVGDAEALLGREHEHAELALVQVVVHLVARPRRSRRAGTPSTASGGSCPRTTSRFASHASR